MAHHHRADRIDVAGHDMSAEAVGEAQRALEVHLVALAQLAEGRPRERLLAHVRDERAADELHDRQTRAVDRDRIADRHVTPELRRVDLESHAPRHARRG
jgi:hypothetical protein